MQLDNTRIPIRERNLLDILDLSLKVTVAFMGPLLFTTAAAVVPLMLLNWWLIGWVPSEGEEAGASARYVWLMAQLVFIEAPLASVPTTLFLGKAMFFQPSHPREMITDMCKLLPQLLWCQFTLRGIAAACFLAAGITREDSLSVGEFFLPILTCYVVVLRAFRPYINEIVLLERNPLRRRKSDDTTVGRRSASLHYSSSGVLLSRWLGSAAVAILITLSVVFTLWFVQGTVLLDWNLGPMMLHFGIPAAMWIVAGYYAVVRFLSYLDLRIRREGWEVELTVRAAANHLAKQLVSAR